MLIHFYRQGPSQKFLSNGSTSQPAERWIRDKQQVRAAPRCRAEVFEAVAVVCRNEGATRAAGFPRRYPISI
jgi:hypothetical protein